MALVVSALSNNFAWSNTIEQELEKRQCLAKKLDNADIVLVVIGRDFHELARVRVWLIGSLLRKAFAEGKTVVPLLVDGARMPAVKDLPASLQNLAYQEALEIEYEQKISGLIARIFATSALPPPSRSSSVPKRHDKRRFIFIAYRRDDSGYWADALARALHHRFGRERVFLDIGSEHPGRDYRSQISNALACATDVVVVIGLGFLEPDSNGVRRIDRPEDQLRFEVRTALQGKKRMHVVLTGQASEPPRDELPKDIAALADIQSIYRLRSDREADRIARKMFSLPALEPSGLERPPSSWDPSTIWES